MHEMDVYLWATLQFQLKFAAIFSWQYTKNNTS